MSEGWLRRKTRGSRTLRSFADRLWQELQPDLSRDDSGDDFASIQLTRDIGFLRSEIKRRGNTYASRVNERNRELERLNTEINQVTGELREAEATDQPNFDQIKQLNGTLRSLNRRRENVTQQINRGQREFLNSMERLKSEEKQKEERLRSRLRK